MKVEILKSMEELSDGVKELLYNCRLHPCDAETPMDVFISRYQAIIIKTGKFETVYTIEDYPHVKELSKLAEENPTGYRLMYMVHAIIADGNIIKNRFGGFNNTNN